MNIISALLASLIFCSICYFAGFPMVLGLAAGALVGFAVGK